MTDPINKNSSVPGQVPLPSELVPGEIAINTADGIVYSLAADGTVFEVGTVGNKTTTSTAAATSLDDIKKGRVFQSNWTPSSTSTGGVVASDFVGSTFNTVSGNLEGGGHMVGRFTYMKAIGGGVVGQIFGDECRMGVSDNTTVPLAVGKKWVFDPDGSGTIQVFTAESFDDMSTSVPYIGRITREFLDPRMATYHGGGIIQFNKIVDHGFVLDDTYSGKELFYNSSSDATFTISPTVAMGWNCRIIHGTLGGKVTVAPGAGRTIVANGPIQTSQTYDALDLKVYDGGFIFASVDTGPVLTGLDTSSGTAVVATDTPRVAIGKLQAQHRNTLRRFGAKGDGVTDDTAALTAAFTSGAKTLYVEAGVYLHSGNFPLPDGLTLIGEGMDSSIFKWIPANSSSRGDMFAASGDINSLVVKGIGFIGNRPYQTTASTSGQDMVAFHIRGGNACGITITDCSFKDFGDTGNTAGGAIIIGPRTGTGKLVQDIVIERNRFQSITNVPGVYINGDSAFTTTTRDISVSNNRFLVDVACSQNCIYVLGGSTTSTVATGVDIRNNKFHVTAAMDTCIELNYAYQFNVSDNSISVGTTGSCTGILVRENALYGDVDGNTLISTATTGTSNTSAICVLQLYTLTQAYLNIANNIIRGWGTGPTATGYSIQVGTGSNYVNVTGNIISGAGTGTNRAQAGIFVGGSRVIVADNQFNNVTYPVTLGPVLSLRIHDNILYNVGDGAVGCIVDPVANQAITDVEISDNKVYSVNAGTPSFVSFTPAATTGNRVQNNRLPTGVNPVNPSLVSKYEVITTPAPTGALMSGTAYSFPQGSIAMDNGVGYTIGGNLDASVPVCSPGDIVMASANVDLQGCIVTPYVSAANTIRIRIENHTGATVTVAAATWRVIVIKATALI